MATGDGAASVDPLAAFVVRLEGLRKRARQPSLKVLEQLTARAGNRLPTSTIHQKLRCESPPDWAFVSSFVGACLRHGREQGAAFLESDADLRAWRQAHDEMLGRLAAFRPAQRHAAAALQQLAAPPATDPPASSIPRQLPSDVNAFVGRDEQIRVLNGLLGPGSTESVGLVVVCGAPGVGKTGLALHWAHRVADQFRDGQVYIDLRGYHPADPLSPADALGALLRSLGVPGADIPFDADERAAFYRTTTADRRLLLILDNAAGSDQVHALLPGSSNCRVVVTSRDRLPALVARYGATRIDLAPLPLDTSVALLLALIGDRAAAERAAITDLARCCAQLPLALRIAAELAADQRTKTIKDLVDKLNDASRSLDALGAGDDQLTALRHVFSWSYHSLPDAARSTWRLLGLHPGYDADLATIAAMTGVDVDDADRTMGVLTRASLIEVHGHRYRSHDLLHTYAAERCLQEDAPAARAAALDRLLAFLLARAIALTRADSAPAETAGTAASAADARAALQDELDNLVALTRFAAAHGRPQYAMTMSETLAEPLYIGAHYAEALAIHQCGLAAAHAIGDLRGEAHGNHRIGVVYRRWGRYDEALEHALRAVTGFRAIADRSGEASALKSLGLIYQRQGRYEEAAQQHGLAHRIAHEIGDRLTAANTLGNLAIVDDLRGRYADAVEHYEEAMALFAALGDRRGVGKTLGNMGIIYARRGQHERALDHHRRSLAVVYELADRAGEGDALDNIGTCYRRMGDYEQACAFLEHALAVRRDVKDRGGEGRTIDGLGIAHAGAGRQADAQRDYRQALDIALEIGDRHLQTRALNGLAETHRALGDLELAQADQAAALTLATEIGDAYQLGRAHDGQAHLLLLGRQPAQARQHWQEALRIFTQLQVPAADEIRQQLDDLDRPG